jgi:hypothetical protein
LLAELNAAAAFSHAEKICAVITSASPSLNVETKPALAIVVAKKAT